MNDDALVDAMDLVQDESNSQSVMLDVGTEKIVHQDFFNDFGDLFDDNDN